MPLLLRRATKLSVRKNNPLERKGHKAPLVDKLCTSGDRLCGKRRGTCAERVHGR